MFRRIIVISLLGFWCVDAAARDLPLYEGAIEIESKSSIADKHHIALSKNKKIDGRWIFDEEVKIGGALIQTLWQIETEDTLQNIADFYQAWVAETGNQLLFHCAARMCGSSNQWANGFFHLKQLYGPDANQFYWVVKQGNIYSIIYLVERGNKKIYLYVEQLQPQSNVADFRVQIPDKCIIDQNFVAGNTVLSEDTGYEYLLVVSVAGMNTLKISQVKAEECSRVLKESFPFLKLHLLGLGEFSASLNRKVRVDQIELVRIQKP